MTTLELSITSAAAQSATSYDWARDLDAPLSEFRSWKHYNAILPLPALKNTYIGIRHARSLANEREELVSDPERAIDNFGLSARGVQELISTLEQPKFRRLVKGVTKVVSSDFLRARQSAQIIVEKLGLPAGAISFQPALRERSCGELEGRHYSAYYPEIDNRDFEDPFHSTYGVEPVVDITARTTAAICELERKYSGEVFLLVTHHAVLCNLMTSFLGISPGNHILLGEIFNAGVLRLEPLHHKPPAEWCSRL